MNARRLPRVARSVSKDTLSQAAARLAPRGHVPLRPAGTPERLGGTAQHRHKVGPHAQLLGAADHNGSRPRPRHLPRPRTRLAAQALLTRTPRPATPTPTRSPRLQGRARATPTRRLTNRLETARPARPAGPNTAAPTACQLVDSQTSLSEKQQRVGRPLRATVRLPESRVAAPRRRHWRRANDPEMMAAPSTERTGSHEHDSGRQPGR